MEQDRPIPTTEGYFIDPTKGKLVKAPFYVDVFVDEHDDVVKKVFEIDPYCEVVAQHEALQGETMIGPFVEQWPNPAKVIYYKMRAGDDDGNNTSPTG